MSCIYCTYKKKGKAADQYNCLCDQFIHPHPLNIGAGLDKLPRQIASFHEFRRALLHDVSAEEVEIIDSNNLLVKTIPLASWRARDKDDLGIMLLEMWAYICDSLSFYDEVIANETYLRTSFLRPNLRRLVALLSYLPRPAVGSVVELAAIADGRLLLKLPAGTAFRSGAFEGNPSQVFEISDDTNIHPFTNRIGILSPHKGIVTTQYPDSLLADPKGEIKEDSLLLLINKSDDTQNKPVLVSKLEKITGIDNRLYNKISFTSPTALRIGALLKDIQLLKPTLTAGLWTISEKNQSIKGKKITLNILTHQIHPGDFILLVYHTQIRWFKVMEVAEVMKPATASNDYKINDITYTMPGLAIPVTELILNDEVNPLQRGVYGVSRGTSYISSGAIVYYGMQLIATIIDEPNATLSGTDPLIFNQLIEKPDENYVPHKFLFEDKNTMGVSVNGSVSFNEKRFVPDQGTRWVQPLTTPVEMYGNVITASRGESVINEKMGSGDASVAGQTFKLKKKPLSYYQSPTADNDQSVKNTLTIFVDGIRWDEVKSFYGKKEYDQVYIVRQNDEGESLVTFGDGIRGQRLPTGKDNIICNYRFGAEAACPPAGSISQISKPVKDLQSVKNVLSAFGGADAESAENLRIYAPRSALILGRVVSMKDMEALASSFPGVRAVQTEWRWDKSKQRASAHIFYIGDAGIRASLSKRIRSVSDPSTPITVEKAMSKPFNISLNVKIDTRYLEEDVVRELRQTLMYKSNSLLSPENIGIGLPLYRSRIFEAVLNVKGTEAVQSIVINGNNFGDFAITPGTGKYFDIESGKLIINGKEE